MGDEQQISQSNVDQVKIMNDDDYRQRLIDRPHPFEHNLVYPYWYYKTFKCKENPLAMHDSSKFPTSYRDIYSFQIPRLDEMESLVGQNLQQYTEIWVNCTVGLFSSGHFIECATLCDSVLRLHFLNPKSRRLGTQYASQLLDTLTRSLLLSGHGKLALPYFPHLFPGKDHDLDTLQLLSRCFLTNFDFFNAAISLLRSITTLPRHTRPWYDLGALVVSVLESVMCQKIVSSQSTSLDDQSVGYQSLVQFAYLCWYRAFCLSPITAPPNQHLSIDSCKSIAKYISCRVPNVTQSSPLFGDTNMTIELEERMSEFVSTDTANFSPAEQLVYQHMSSVRPQVIEKLNHQVQIVQKDYVQQLMDLPPEATQRQNITLPTDIVELFPQGDLGASQIESLVLASLKALRSATKQENQLEKQLNSAELLSRPIKNVDHLKLCSLQLSMDEADDYSPFLPYLTKKEHMSEDLQSISNEDILNRLANFAKEVADSIIIRTATSSMYRNKYLFIRDNFASSTETSLRNNDLVDANEEDESEATFVTKAKPVSEEIEQLKEAVADDANRNKARPMNPREL